MMRSMFSGVSSLRAHQLRMDVIGNNIANVNTVGYKSSSVTFAETFSQTLQGASSSTPARGGTNPMQVGLGTSVSSISVNHTRGSIQRTDVATDLMIDGSGFFMVTNDVNAQNKFYTRAGNFNVDELGFLVTTDGLKVLDNNFKPIQINQSDTVMAQATGKVVINGNLNFNDTAYNTTIDLYSSLGSIRTVNVRFGQNMTTSKEADTLDPIVEGIVPPLPDLNYSFRPVSFTDAAGNNIATTDGVNPLVNLFAKFNENGEIVNLVQLADPADPTTAETVDPGTWSLNIGVPGASNINVPLNRSIFFANGNDADGRVFSQYAQESDAKGVQLGGNSAGTIDTFNISSKGEVVGIYTNGERKVLQVIGLVDFDNPAGLMKIGGNLFQNTPNSGTPKYGSPASGSFGSLAAGALEMSNVDIAAQFTDMITTQRGFQANSRVISTSDEILQELVNLKR